MRIFGIFIGLILFFILVPGAVVTGWMWTSLPKTDGEIAVGGLERTVTITRDEYGIPMIEAQSARDAYFSLGYLHAQDRLWQMDFQRRVAAGELSEIIGSKGLKSDKWMRTLNLYGRAEESYDKLHQSVQIAVDSYSDGVNAYLTDHWGALPLEFELLQYQPRRWKRGDTLVWGKMMGLMLSGNWKDELLRARLAKKLSSDQLRQLWPSYPTDAPTTMVNHLPQDLIESLDEAAEGFFPPSRASNVWVFNGKRTSTGKPILANDPHLGFQLPNIWYLAKIKTPDMDVTGATIPGVPYVVIGHNKKIAWGFTSTYGDTQDLFIEKINPKDGAQYMTERGAARFDTREETIQVRGQEPINITVRETYHGPVISDISEDFEGLRQGGFVISLGASMLDTRDFTAQGFQKLNFASNWPEFLNAMADIHTPQQNAVYADVAGNIGFATVGKIPVRKSGDGFMPSIGWNGAHDWSGYLSFTHHPQKLNPEKGFFINANNKMVDAAYPYFISHEWDAPFRATRIEDLLVNNQDNATSIEDHQAVQLDVTSSIAPALLPVMLEQGFGNENTHPAISLLRKWDYKMDKDHPEGLIFTAWLRAFNRAVYEDDVGSAFDQFWALRPLFIQKVLTQYPQWCDIKSTEDVESCGVILQQSFDHAMVALQSRYGDDVDDWEWGEAHQINLSHPILSKIPFIKNKARLQLPTDGGDQTINRGAMEINNGAAPFVDTHGPGLRAIYDLENLDQSRFIQLSGQSGNILSSHYKDLVDLWAEGTYLTLSEDHFRAHKDRKLTMIPRY